eukprot:TRINITY_DN4782_c0_g1_i1.p1 TRINITY_DN4782_c0_g1~~TRINITY_DN4782_c0_g1_i1.p1  ORF type:complete len:709 (-),score=46.99 TRINITY_DN4782_c0_g1_i1:160-2286(-)
MRVIFSCFLLIYLAAPGQSSEIDSGVPNYVLLQRIAKFRNYAGLVSNVSSAGWPVTHTGKECCGASSASRDCATSTRFGSMVTLLECQRACQDSDTCVAFEFGRARSDKWNRCDGVKCRCYLAYKCQNQRSHNGYNIYRKPGVVENPAYRRRSTCTAGTLQEPPLQEKRRKCEDTLGDFECISMPTTTWCSCPSGRFPDQTRQFCLKGCDGRRRKLKTQKKTCTESFGTYTCLEKDMKPVAACICPAGYKADFSGFADGFTCVKIGACSQAVQKERYVEQAKYRCEVSNGVFTCTDTDGSIETSCDCPSGWQPDSSGGCASLATPSPTTTTTKSTSTTTTTTVTSTTTAAVATTTKAPSPSSAPGVATTTKGPSPSSASGSPASTPTCPGDQVWSETAGCVCQGRSIMAWSVSENRCINRNSCQAPKEYDDSAQDCVQTAACRSKMDAVKSAGVCIEKLRSTDFGSPAYEVKIAGGVLKNCHPDYEEHHLDGGGRPPMFGIKRCGCPDGEVLKDDGSFVSNGRNKEKRCFPRGSIWDAESGCRCVNSKWSDSENRCVAPTCPGDQVWSETAGCVCQGRSIMAWSVSENRCINRNSCQAPKEYDDSAQDCVQTAACRSKMDAVKSAGVCIEKLRSTDFGSPAYEVKIAGGVLKNCHPDYEEHHLDGGGRPPMFGIKRCGCPDGEVLKDDGTSVSNGRDKKKRCCPRGSI